MTQSHEAAPAVAQPDVRGAAESQPEPVQTPSAVDIVNRSMELARLEAQIAKNWDSYQKRPRRKFIGARTQEFRFARYVEDWRNKIERIGTLNYPTAARDQRIFGTLQLTVAIRADGSVETVEINRPSGQKVLDEAALRIVGLAAPFAAFPPDIAQDTDILSITRTWSFTRSDQFQAE
jgi:protein TonB